MQRCSQEYLEMLKNGVFFARRPQLQLDLEVCVSSVSEIAEFYTDQGFEVE
jgi:hypothetical protein